MECDPTWPSHDGNQESRHKRSNDSPLSPCINILCNAWTYRGDALVWSILPSFDEVKVVYLNTT